jgi:CheY-like chemotaxis protein
MSAALSKRLAHLKANRARLCDNTPSSDAADRQKAESSGFHQFVSKPYKHQALLNALRH